MKKLTLLITLAMICLTGFLPVSEIKPGAGSFVFSEHELLGEKPVNIHYYRPEGDVRLMPVLFVMHGTNRNADEYRDNWIELAEKYSVLIIAPEFSHENFPGSRGYNLGSMFDRDDNPVEESRWAYSLIEPIFDYVVALTESRQTTYDMFGHSAGSQFAHRFFLFKRDIRVNHVITSNAGWYTMPDFETEFPYGLKNTMMDEQMLKKRFAQHLVIQLGEDDNDPAHRYLRTTDQAMRQGDHRFERGYRFYQTAEEMAGKLGVPLNWSVRTVPGVGHNNAGMAVDAAQYLYGN